MSTLVHGTRSAYVGGGRKKGCRCADCREAHRLYMAAHRAMVKSPPTEHPAHGTRNGYDHYQCRCASCVRAHQQAHREYYAAHRDALLARQRVRDRKRRAKTGGS